MYRDLLRQSDIVVAKITYGNTIDPKTSEKIARGHKKRYEVFKKHETEFWEKYVEYALSDWRNAVNELTKEEIEHAYETLGILYEPSWTVNRLRKDAIQRFQTEEEKRTFWRTANEYLIYDHFLEIGPAGWHVEADVKEFGLNRTRFIVLNFPLDEGLEELRTEYIAKVVKKESGDVQFLFRRITQISDELNRVRQKCTEYYHEIEKLKIEIAKYQSSLHEAYQQIRELRSGEKVYHRDPADIRKIHELKELVKELKQENQALQERLPEIEQPKPVLLEETAPKEKEEIDMSILENKTIGILGGHRQRQAQTYPYNILTHPADRLDPDFYATITNSDIILVLTEHISHAAMWEAKELAIEQDKPIYFERGVNIGRLLENVAKEENRKVKRP
ncbi:hypothetical protein BSNK01_12180 [Bacillaceae bacterium]